MRVCSFRSTLQAPLCRPFIFQPPFYLPTQNCQSVVAVLQLEKNFVLASWLLDLRSLYFVSFHRLGCCCCAWIC
ncbi:hypothetical protein NC651_032732 [Populus alba x Populus x berolinensis]|nr:hypothetical protein NC651_032732 [Populus alba x Populus x berolinensis]